MKISVAKSNSNTAFQPVTVGEFDSMDDLILKHTYSCSTFKNNYRNNDNFESTECIALDFDDGLTLEAAEFAFRKYKNIIAPTRNHQKEKHGKTCDRYRVILFLSEPITESKVYHNTYKSLLEKFPMADTTSDPARMFYPSQSIYSSTDGETIVPVAPTPKEITVKDVDDIDFSSKPNGWSSCSWSIANGYFESGERNEAMMSLCSLLKKLKHTKEQAYYMCKNALKLRETRTGAPFDSDELWTTVIKQIYSNSWKGVVYSCGTPSWLSDYCDSLGPHSCTKEVSAFNFCTLDELFESTIKIDWCVDGLFSEGGLSIIVGKPKSGKSTLARQLALNVARGEKFLGRSTKSGKVMYVALEEQIGMLKRQFRSLGATGKDNMILHVGSAVSLDPLKDLQEQVEKNQPRMLIIDTLLLLLKVENDNGYNEMNKVLSRLRDIARSTGTHIVTLHHQNKGMPGMSQNRGGDSIMGSSAIHGAMDSILIFNKIGTRRVINTEGRGITDFTNQELEFDKKTETYTLGVKHDEF